MEKFYEPYSFFYPNEVSYIGRALFKYHTTILFELEYMCCDERRITLAVPQYEYLALKNVCNWYYYYELDSLQGFFLAFLTNSTFDFVSRGGAAPFICFKNSEERKKFNEYILGKTKDPFRINTIEEYLKQNDKRIPKIRYVITLDADTDLVLNSGIELIGAMAHILNLPVLNKSKDAVIDGHAIMQPRVGIRTCCK